MIFASKETFNPCQEEFIFECEDNDSPVRLNSSLKKLCMIKTKFAIDYELLNNFTGQSGKKLKNPSSRLKWYRPELPMSLAFGMKAKS